MSRHDGDLRPLQGVGLFSGIGGIELAMQRNGVQTVAMCEIDPAATRVLNHRFPGIPVFDDVRKVTGDALRNLGAVPARTILSAGFPCTDLSVAGRRAAGWRVIAERPARAGWSCPSRPRSDARYQPLDRVLWEAPR